MKNHVKIYREYYGYGEEDLVVCECGCDRIAVSVHHLIPKSAGGGDNIENLIGLTMECHDRAERGKDRKEFNDKLKAIKKAEFVSQRTKVNVGRMVLMRT